MATFLCGFPLLLQCLGMPSIPEDQYSTDYYFTGFSVQITGTAAIPPSILTRKYENASRREFINFDERLELCKQKAILQADSKWLSITEDDPNTQFEWIRRLDLGAKGPWTGCLEDAETRYVLFDYPGSCTVVRQYPCDPAYY
ncbi:MAG: hypothetical protein KDK33_09890 [Leptospiraceae bacterium]|nr:hypothetical protein [Leptospiraceae bacterium]